MIKCGIIRRSVIRGEMTTIILNDQWISLILEYELIIVEFIKSKVDVLVVSKLLRRDTLFIRIGY